MCSNHMILSCVSHQFSILFSVSNMRTFISSIRIGSTLHILYIFINSLWITSFRAICTRFIFLITFIPFLHLKTTTFAVYKHSVFTIYMCKYVYAQFSKIHGFHRFTKYIYTHIKIITNTEKKKQLFKKCILYMQINENTFSSSWMA